MGVQSLHDPTPCASARAHPHSGRGARLEDARRAGFDNVNLDFIFGLPGQTVEQWDVTLREIVGWGAEHFSLYSLILEESTPLYAQVLGGRVSVPDEDSTAEMYERAIEGFGAAGYAQYEISNWAKAANQEPRIENQNVGEREILGFSVLGSRVGLPPQPGLLAERRHLAAGSAGAHEHVFPAALLGCARHRRLYRARLGGGGSPLAELIELSARDLAAETMFMGLWLNSGVGFAHFRERCGTEMRDVLDDELRELEALGLPAADELGVRLTARGRMLGNQVSRALV